MGMCGRTLGDARVVDSVQHFCHFFISLPVHRNKGGTVLRGLGGLCLCPGGVRRWNSIQSTTGQRKCMFCMENAEITTCSFPEMGFVFLSCAFEFIQYVIKTHTQIMCNQCTSMSRSPPRQMPEWPTTRDITGHNVRIWDANAIVSRHNHSTHWGPIEITQGRTTNLIYLDYSDFQDCSRPPKEPDINHILLTTNLK